MLDMIPFEFSSHEGRLLSLAVIVSVVMWFITACINAVDFDEAKKFDANTGVPTTAWLTALTLVALSTASLIATLVCLAVSIYGMVNEGQDGPPNEKLKEAEARLKAAQEAAKTAKAATAAKPAKPDIKAAQPVAANRAAAASSAAAAAVKLEQPTTVPYAVAVHP